MINCINTCAGDSFRYESKGHTHKDCDLADDISARALVIPPDCHEALQVEVSSAIWKW